jgi:hypothetical protein
MEIVSEPKYRIRWYDPEKTILLCEVMERWSWEETHSVIQKMNDTCSTVQHGVYSIFHFQKNASLLPQGKTAIGDVRKLIETEHPNDQLIIFIGASTLVTSLVNIAGQVYGMRNIIARFRFVYSLEEALTAVGQHKAENKRGERISRPNDPA